MAQITGATNEKVYSVSKWLGVNEHPDGDTRLKMGEASRMVNWKVTRDGNLKRRPGTEFVAGLCSGYELSVSTKLTLIGVFAATDKIRLYESASTDANPGTITLGDTIGYVRDGIIHGLDGTVEDGVFTAGEDAEITVSHGVMTGSAGGTDMQMQNLATALAALDEGDFYYIYYDEVYYAINNTCLVQDHDQYMLSGYIATAVPTSAAKPIAGMWTGLCGGKEVLLAACDGKVYSLWDDDNKQFERQAVGTISTDKGVSFFPFNNKVYILNGYDYYEYNGSTVSAVTGYIPVIVKQLSPDGSASPGGTETGSYVNLLINKRKVWISPDGNTNKTFTLPEDITAVDSVTDRSTGTALTVNTDYTVSGNQVTFTSNVELVAGVDAYEIAYTVPKHNPATVPDDGIPDYRAQVTGNLYAELFAGATDTAVFLYGNGTNRAIYTGMDEDGMPQADYFPDQYSVDVGDSNTPITAMIRHSGALVTFKTDSAWALTYSVTELVNENDTIAIYCTPLNKDKGNTVPGQVQLVQNNPITCSGTELYQWTGVSRYSSSIGRDERNAKRISDRVQTSIKEVSSKAICMWDDNDNCEFYIAGNGIALVWNYVLDVWYRYETFDAVRMCSFHGEVYYGSSDGRIRRLTDNANGDEGLAIHADWESGAMDFGAGNMRKYSSAMWVGLKPEEGTSVDVCIETDRKNTFREKVVSSTKAKVAGQPFMTRTKIKAKKFVYYRLKLSVDDKQPAVTVTDVNILVRATGYAK